MKLSLNLKQILLLSIFGLFLIVIGYQYYQIQSIKGEQLDKLENAEQDRVKSIDSLGRIQTGRDKVIDSIIKSNDSLKAQLQILLDYVPDNNDVDNATTSKLEQLLTRYYHKR